VTTLEKFSLIAICVVVVLGGVYYVGYRAGASSAAPAGTTVPPAPVVFQPIPATPIPAKPVPPDTVYLAFPVGDSTLSQRIDELITDNGHLIGEQEILNKKLASYLQPHYATQPFRLEFEGGSVTGWADLGYAPIDKSFALKLTPVNLTIPICPPQRKQPWWVKPAAAVGGALTYHFISKDNLTGSLIAGGATGLLIAIEF